MDQAVNDSRKSNILFEQAWIFLCVLVFVTTVLNSLPTIQFLGTAMQVQLENSLCLYLPDDRSAFW